MITELYFLPQTGQHQFKPVELINVRKMQVVAVYTLYVAGVCKCSEGDLPPRVLRLRPMRSDRRSGRLPPGGRTDLLREGLDVLRFIYMY